MYSNQLYSTSQTQEQNNKDKPRQYNILVYIRVRPPLPIEYGKEMAVSCHSDKRTLIIDTKGQEIQTHFDRAFDESITQKEVFEHVSHFVPAIISGFNCTVFAYGQTGSGKTHTMFGNDWESLLSHKQNTTNIQATYIDNIEKDEMFSGLIPRTIYDLFRTLEQVQGDGSKYVVYCSFLQIYNEKIYDLLRDRYSVKPLSIHENKFDGIYVDGLTEYCVNSSRDCLLLMQKGEQNRFIRSTSHNVKSSRSHTIFQIIVETMKADGHGKLQKAKLNLCDLAGSEKVNKSEAMNHAHFKELTNINLSLTTLGKVIHSLSQNKKLVVPYRESKLTRLLQDSLGGNTRTCLIATLSPTIDCVDETLNTLKFAERAQHVVTSVISNKVHAQDAQLVSKLQKEIQYLREILNIRRKGTSSINDVHNKLLLLQQENDRLRQSHISVNEVETLVEENRKMKMELQKLRGSSRGGNSSDNALSHTDTVYGSNENDIIPFSKNYMSEVPMRPSQNINHAMQSPYIEDPKEYKSNNHSKKPSLESMDLLRLNQSRIGSEMYSTPNRGNFSLSQRTTDSRNNHRSHLGDINGLSKVSATPQLKENRVSIPVRIKGKDPYQGKISENKTPLQIKKLEERKKEQKRALERLQALDKLQKDHQKRMQHIDLNDTSSGGFAQMPNIAPKSSRNKSYDHRQERGSFNPFKEIENKYRTQKQNILEEKNRRNLEVNSKRMKYLEKNFLQS